MTRQYTCDAPPFQALHLHCTLQEALQLTTAYASTVCTIYSTSGLPFDCHHLAIGLSPSFVHDSVPTPAYCLLHIIISKASNNNWHCSIITVALLEIETLMLLEPHVDHCVLYGSKCCCLQ